MTNDEKAQRALAALDPIRIANRLQQRRKQAINNARVTDMSRSLLVEIQKDLLPNERVTIYHVSHMLNRFGVPHFRSYDKKRFNGITFAFVSTGETNSPVKIYTAFCDKSDTYSRKLGRLEVLDRIQKDLISTKKGTPISEHNPILLDTVAAFKYLNPLSGNVNKQSIVRAAIDWYITTHVNKPKKVQKSVEYTRSQVAEAEKALVSKAEKDLRNIADLRVVYSHTAPDSLGFNVPLAIRRLEDPNYRAIRETTKVKLALAATQRNSVLSEEVVESLKEVLESSSVEVHRHKDDKPNRVNARMFALRKFVKTNF